VRHAQFIVLVVFHSKLTTAVSYRLKTTMIDASHKVSAPAGVRKNNDARYADWWARLAPLDRAAAVVRYHSQGCNHRRLAKMLGCSEGTIRNYELLGRLTVQAQTMYYEGRISLRKLLRIAREQDKRRSQTR